VIIDVEALVAEMTLEEKTRLTAGADMWSTAAVERLGVPSIEVTDGPSGARGPVLPGQQTDPSLSVPCGSALGATWDPVLIERVGRVLGREARRKGCRVLLAPTVNLHRSPLAGRNFECYSEDPLLAGKLAAAFVRGAQSEGVVTTVKHFAGNEAEFQRQSINSVVDERALRELYLVPFELAVREGGTLGVMTAYNRLNGPFCAEHTELLTDILRGEWGFEGFVLTDWFAAGSTVGSAAAGLDLEMPGPGRFFGPALADAVHHGAVPEKDVDAQVTRLLSTLARVGAFDDPADDMAERGIATEGHSDDRLLAREAAAASFVLLRNDGLLPLAPDVRSLAVIGPNAGRAQIGGGGSASLLAHHRTTPVDALRARLGVEVQLTYERGCDTDRVAPSVDSARLRTADDQPGLDVEVFAGEDFTGPVVHHARWNDTRMLFLGEPVPGLGADFSIRATAELTPTETGRHTLTLVQAGRARALLDGDVVLDGTTGTFERGHEFFGLGSVEIGASVDLVAGRPAKLVIEYSSRDSGGFGAVKVGCRGPGTDPQLIERAVGAAAAADVVVLVVGTNDDWESEGHDRDTLALPGAQDELAARVLAANPNTVVVVNAGAPVDLSTVDDARAVLQVWLGGQEMAPALADVLFGDAEPAGRLPMSIPARLEDNPSFGNFPGEHGEVRYGEGLLMGYRWYDTRRILPRYPFGHGLSYSTFAIGEPVVRAPTFSPGDQLLIDVSVTNTGERRGSEVVQCYVVPLGPRVFRPRKELKVFAKVSLDPGEHRTVQLVLDDRSFAAWDPEQRDWRIDPGDYELHIGRSASDVAHTLPLRVAPQPGVS